MGGGGKGVYEEGVVLYWYYSRDTLGGKRTNGS